MSIFAADGVATVLHSALDGYTLRQNVIADNIANVDTPDFRASSVEFEGSLRAMIESGDVSRSGLSLTSTATASPVGANGNNVDLRKETMAAMQTVFQFQLVTRAVNDRHTLMRTAAGSF